MNNDPSINSMPTQRTIKSEFAAGKAFDIDSDKTIKTQKQRPPVELNPATGSHRFRAGEDIIGRYTVIDELGQGGMGVVYQCLDKIGRIQVALKVLPPELSHNADEMEKICENYQIVSSLVHQNIAIYKNLEKNEINGNYYLVMELVEGVEFSRWLRKKHREADTISLYELMPIFKGIASALDYSHKRKVIHRDIKPGNIMITSEGDAKVLDFGLAAEVHSSMSRVSQNPSGKSGTRPYMAPEQWQGKRQSAATDQYAFAVMVYEALAGYLPFDNDDVDVLARAVLHETPDEIEDVAPAAMNAIFKAMSKSPKDRFASCMEFVEALEGKTATVPAAEKTPQQPKPMAEPKKAVEPVIKQGEERSIEQASLNEIDLGNGVTLDMVEVKAGSFKMGSSNNEEGRYDDEAPHHVTLTKNFWMGKFEVTQEQYEAVMGTNPSYFKGAKHPVENVSWNDAMKFCKRMNEKYAQHLPPGYKFTLPTEAQWEYACRGGTTTSLNNGEDMRILGKNNSPNLDKLGWYGGNCGQEFYLSNGYGISGWPEKQYKDDKGGTHPVGKKLPNAFGLYDMHGNVWEWCLDWYGDYPSDAVTDPTGPASGSGRVCRGGGWCNCAQYCRSADRYWFAPSGSDNDLGFRLACSASGR